MWVNSTQREEPYLGSKCSGIRQKRRRLAIDRYIGAAWLSSARVVRCWVKSRNERNPCELLPPSREARALCSDCPALTGGKVGTTSSQYGPYGLGCTRTTMPSTERSKTARWRKSLKLGPVQIEVCNSTS